MWDQEARTHVPIMPGSVGVVLSFERDLITGIVGDWILVHINGYIVLAMVHEFEIVR